MLHYALGNPVVRALTLASRPFFDDPPADFSDVPLGHRMPVLVHARQDELAELETLDAELAPFATLQRVGEAEIRQICPVLRVGDGGAVSAILDPAGLRLDPHALLQGHARLLRRHGGTLIAGARAVAIRQSAGVWTVETEREGAFSAPVIVNAAGAWADSIAQLAGVAALDIRPKRRTIITFDGPEGADPSRWPFAKTVGDELYFAPESGRLFASPMDEVPTGPCDAQPDDLEVAIAADRVEERTTMRVRRILHKWAGLRTFTPDGVPAVGFDPAADRFFWLAGQGGFGLQTSPAIASAVESLIAGTSWPLAAVDPSELDPQRLRDHSPIR